MSVSRRPPRALRPRVALLALSTAVIGFAAAAPAFATPARADLAIDVTASPARIPVTGKVVEVEVNLKNRGGAVANAPSVTIRLPSGTSVAGEGPPSDSAWQCELSQPGITCTHAALAAAESAASLVLPIRVPAGEDGESLTVTAVADTSSPETSAGNNSDKVAITYDADIVLPDLYFSSTAKRPDYYVVAGDWVRFGVDVGNAGNGVAEGVAVRVTASPNLTAMGVNDWSDPSWQCTLLSAPNEWNCVHEPLAPGATAGPLQFTAHVASGSPGELLPYTFTVATTTAGDDTANNGFESAFEYSAAVLRGQLWEDVDNDGQRGAADVALAAGASVQLVPVYGGGVIDVPLNADGSFNLFVKPDPYYVEVTISDATYLYTTPNVGDDTADSDITPLYDGLGQSSVFDLSNGNVEVIDIGLVKIAA